MIAIIIDATGIGLKFVHQRILYLLCDKLKNWFVHYREPHEKYFLVTALSFSLSSYAFGQTNQLEGTYECIGNEVGTNATFKCEMTIKQTGKTFASKASCSDGNSYSGTGIYDKNLSRLSTGFINPKKSEETGISVTEVGHDGSLITAWTYLNNTGIGHTKCVKQKTGS